MERFKIFFCSLVAGSFTLGMAASSSIGMINAPGSFQINGAQVFGNATLFEGTVLQTGSVTGDLRFRTGARMQLSSDSRAKVYRDRLVLEQGIGQMEGKGYRIE